MFGCFSTSGLVQMLIRQYQGVGPQGHMWTLQLHSPRLECETWVLTFDPIKRRNVSTFLPLDFFVLSKSQENGTLEHKRQPTKFSGQTKSLSLWSSGSARVCELESDSDLTWVPVQCSTSPLRILPPSHRLLSWRMKHLDVGRESIFCVGRVGTSFSSPHNAFLLAFLYSQSTCTFQKIISGSLSHPDAFC